MCESRARANPSDTDREARLEEIRAEWADMNDISTPAYENSPATIRGVRWLLSEIDRLREIEEAASEVLRHEDTASDHGPGDGAFIDSYRAAFNHLRQALHEGDEDGSAD